MLVFLDSNFSHSRHKPYCDINLGYGSMQKSAGTISTYFHLLQGLVIGLRFMSNGSLGVNMKDFPPLPHEYVMN